ncbi:hypothetical protein N866_13165 [Actinotalea ferrariae CF5-4]|uniref:O-antigen ligase-related domain-containing protein n=1 Tax=Actinotalea ferrariae CF5-4 TaxID=948458 RepID=A0A021VYQ6_9CELL|nr:O-antigen ligase family protein [Actinotalea ferrariae]EYR65145.1 hypothetical protein N866_13165 [Actinotalea ferrariae CF5-4]
MLAPVVVSGADRLSIVGYANFAIFTVGGIAVGTLWGLAGRKFGAIDYGLTAFVALAGADLANQLIDAETGGLHAAAILEWGGSNYVAGALVVASMGLLARMRTVQAPAYAYLLPFSAVCVAVLTLSRGALVAAAVGIAVLLWRTGRSFGARALHRTGALLAVAGTFIALERVTAERSVGGYDPARNIDARVELAQIAWQEFQNAPVFGTGWYALRHSTVHLGELSFAHNVVFSFLQIGGAFGALYLFVLFGAAAKALRGQTVFLAPVMAALAISMSDPFFEGGPAAFLGWMVVVRSVAAAEPSHSAVRNGQQQ